MIFRELQLQDTSQMAQIELDSFSEPWREASFVEAIEHPEIFFYVAEEAGEVLAYCGAVESFDEADVVNVATKKEHRNKGICKELLQYMMKEEAKKGISRFSLDVRVSNLAAIHVYESLGFESAGIRPGFYSKPKEDSNVMWCEWKDIKE